MKKRHTKLMLALGVLLALALGILSFILYQRQHADILKGTEFSASYTDRNGELLQVFLTSDDKYRVFCPIANFTPNFIEAILLQEDKYFFNHGPVNIASIAKAAWITYVKKDRVVGASTITMQVAKLKYRIYTRSFWGKIKQIFLSLYLEMCFSKQDILEAYLNLVPVGGNLEGFFTGSLYYFHKNIQNLTLSETLMLCTLPQNPTKRAPSEVHTPTELLQAKKILFSKWIENHSEDKDKEVYMDMQMSTFCSFPNEARHFCEMLYRQKNIVERSPVRTSLDLSVQKKSEKILKSYINQNKNFGLKNASILLLDWTTMEVIANIGSADYYNYEILGQVNATTSKRSPGSTLKPFIYALALEQGLIHYDTMLKDTPQSFSEYTPDNYGSIFKGPVKAWYALVDSRNIPAISLAREIKNPDLYDFMKDCGVTKMKSKDYYGLSIVLGSCEVTMEELVRMYATVPNGGLLKDINFIHPSPLKTKKRVLSEESAFIVQKMLEQNEPPYSKKFNSDIPIAYKTGTSIGFKDGWSVGIFDQYVLCVWIGNFDGQGNNSFVGRPMAAPLLFNIANEISDTVPSNATAAVLGTVPSRATVNALDTVPSGASTTAPSDVTQVEVCSVSGNLPCPDCPTTELSWFIPGVSPIDKCKIHRKINIDTRTGYRTDETDKSYVKTVVREFWPSDLQDLFTQAGFPRITIPPYPDETHTFDNKKQGFPPHITSPLENTEYVLREDDEVHNKIILSAIADADTDEFLWFCDSNFIARTKNGQSVEWLPSVGKHEITVTDEMGRSDSVKFNIVWASGE